MLILVPAKALSATYYKIYLRAYCVYAQSNFVFYTFILISSKKCRYCIFKKEKASVDENSPKRQTHMRCSDDWGRSKAC